MCCFPDIHYMVFIMDFDSERDAMITNHTISWGYIVNRMKNKYGISPDDREKFSMAEINQYIENIWDEYCDEDYGEILKYHRENHNEITVVAAIKNMSIPYGTLETKEEGLLSGIKEKPEYTFKINTGMYILETHLLKEIPSNRVYHITYLIDKLVKEGRRVGVFPVNEGSWTDVGNWDEYLKQFVTK